MLVNLSWISNNHFNFFIIKVFSGLDWAAR